MTKKHYISFAAMFHTELSYLSDVGSDLVSRRMILRLAEQSANLFAVDNPRFNRATFMRACGL